MDMVLYVILFTGIGLYNVNKNGGFTVREKSELSTVIEDVEVSSIVDGMEMGSNLYGNYDREAFCDIVKQLGLM